MKRLAFLLSSIVWLTNGSTGWADLEAEVKAVAADKLLRRAEVGVALMRLGSTPADASLVFRHNAQSPLIPASNMKLLTTAAALDRLGGDFRFRTVLLLREKDLILWGDGDPSLGDAELLKTSGWGVTTVFNNWAAELRQRGVTQVRNVIVDDSVFDEIFIHPRWPPEQAHKRYAAQVGGVNLNANCVDFYVRVRSAGELVAHELDPPTRYITVANTCVGGNNNAIWLSRQLGGNDVILRGEARADTQAPVSVSVHDPPMFAATVLAETLSAAGVRVSGSVLRDRTTRARYAADPGAQWAVVAVHETPLSAVLGRANKDSMNVYAEALCKRLGRETSGQSGSWENGTAALADFLRRAGADERQFRIDDGSGLSRHNAVSADALCRALAFTFHSSHRQVYLDSLAVGGIDGTLENRFKNTDLRGRVLAKSGFISGVSALSGYLRSRQGQWYGFSILINGIAEGSNSGVKMLQERIVRGMDEEFN